MHGVELLLVLLAGGRAGDRCCMLAPENNGQILPVSSPSKAGTQANQKASHSQNIKHASLHSSMYLLSSCSFFSFFFFCFGSSLLYICVLTGQVRILCDSASSSLFSFAFCVCVCVYIQPAQQNGCRRQRGDSAATPKQGRWRVPRASGYG